MYYGWVIVALAFAALMTSYSLLFGYSVFVPHLAGALDLSRAAVSAPFSVCVAVYSVLSLITGRLTDRIGPRGVMLSGGVALAGGYAVVAIADSQLLLFIGMGAVVGIGMSAAYIPCTATVVRWFLARRGLALAIASMGLSASMAAGPFAAVVAIEALAWREAALVLGLVCGGAVALCAFGMRRDPGSGFADRVRGGVTLPEEASLTFAEAPPTTAPD
jgi:OFA family oxalate/formate antiporter-like MFS transporter